MKQMFILDMETIGQSVFKSPIVNCSFFTFDWDRFTSDNPYTFDELLKEIQFAKLDIEYQKKHDGCKIEKKDLQFWLDLPKEARSQIMPSDEDITTKEFVEVLTKYLNGSNIRKWWSRANCFDPLFVQRAFEQYSSNDHLNILLPFWFLRDTRTYIDAKFNMEIKKNAFCPIDDEDEWKEIFIEHNSIHDVAADILRIQKIERAINL